MLIMENKKNITLITGATGGLGRAFCTQAIKLNHNLLICGTKEQALLSLKNELLKLNDKVEIFTYAFNLSDKPQIDNLINFINDNNLNVQMLINNAGFITEGSIKNSSKQTLMNAIQVNCEGTIYLSKSILDNRDINQKLNIITISSLASCYPLPYMAIYAATKVLIKNFMLALRYEYKNENVKVLVVQPGAIATSDDMKNAIKAQGLKGKMSCVKPEIIAKKSIKKPLKGKTNYVPGFFNKLTKFVSSLTPLSLQIKVAGKMWKKSQNKRNII